MPANIGSSFQRREGFLVRFLLEYINTLDFRAKAPHTVTDYHLSRLSFCGPLG